MLDFGHNMTIGQYIWVGEGSSTRQENMSQHCFVTFHLHDTVHVSFPLRGWINNGKHIWDFWHMEKSKKTAHNYSIAQKCFSVEISKQKNSRKSCKYLEQNERKYSHKTHSRGFACVCKWTIGSWNRRLWFLSHHHHNVCGGQGEGGRKEKISDHAHSSPINSKFKEEKKKIHFPLFSFVVGFRFMLHMNELRKGRGWEDLKMMSKAIY